MFQFPEPEVNSEKTAQHFSSVCEIAVSSGSYYRNAYLRWENRINALKKQASADFRSCELLHRALIGMSNPSLWESNISLHATYGVPHIPGSACKGLAAHFAKEQLGMEESEIDAIFGSSDAARKICFQDAWWVPDSAPTIQGRLGDQPLVREITTPHHPEFLSSRGLTPATPYDSPEPIPQLATHGKFLFAVTGPKLWAEYAMNILQVALEVEGIGARTPEYGCIQITDGGTTA